MLPTIFFEKSIKDRYGAQVTNHNGAPHFLILWNYRIILCICIIVYYFISLVIINSFLVYWFVFLALEEGPTFLMIVLKIHSYPFLPLLFYQIWSWANPIFGFINHKTRRILFLNCYSSQLWSFYLYFFDCLSNYLLVLLHRRSLMGTILFLNYLCCYSLNSRPSVLSCK